MYMHTNKTNGKKYIGITGRDAELRWGANGCRYKCHFASAIKKYGWDGFEHEILYSGLSKAEAQKLETELILEFNTTSVQCGYNMTFGGECEIPNEVTRFKMSVARKRRITSDETRAKMSLSSRGNKHNLGHKCPDEVKAKLSAAMAGKKNTLGHKLSDEHIAKIRASNIGKTVTREAIEKTSAAKFKSVVRLSLDGEFIKQYSNIKSAEAESGARHVSECCHGTLKSSGGFKWNFSEQYYKKAEELNI